MQGFSILAMVLAAAVSSWAQIQIQCETLGFPSYQLRTEVIGYEPRDHLDQFVDVRVDNSHFKGSILNSLLEAQGKRIFLEVLLPEEQTPQTDRTISVMASWIGDSGEPALAQGVLIDSVYDHKRGRVQEGPQLKAQCLLSNLETK